MKVQKVLKVRNRLGLHARPAAVFVQTVSKFKCAVKVSKGGVEVNGKSMMGLMMLAAEQGSELKITLDGDDAAEAIKQIEQMFENNFGDPAHG